MHSFCQHHQGTERTLEEGIVCLFNRQLSLLESTEKEDEKNKQKWEELKKGVKENTEHEQQV